MPSAIVRLPSASLLTPLPLYVLGSFGRSFLRETGTAQAASLGMWRDGTPIFYADANDGGIKRGDRGDVDDTEARPAVKDPAAQNKNERDPGPPGVDDETDPDSIARDPDASGTEILDAEDRSLGLTDVGPVPPDDWAADTGETRIGESRQK